MSAPKNAVPMFDPIKDKDKLKDMGVTNHQTGKKLIGQAALDALPGVSCDCGFNGKYWELLEDPNNDKPTLWCPTCRTAAWSYN